MRRKRRAWASFALVSALSLAGVGDITYVVVKGDTLAGIARKQGTTQKALAELNRLPNVNMVRIGQQLRIPGTAAPASATPVATSILHKVAAGENLSRIAARYGTRVSGLVKLNKLTDPDHLRLGQVLTIPVVVTPAAATVGAPNVEELLVRYSRQYGVNPNLVKAIAWQESGWKQGVVSSTGAVQIPAGQIKGTIDGEVQDIHPHDQSVQRGMMVEIELTTPSAEGNTVLFAGGKPLWLF